MDVSVIASHLGRSYVCELNDQDSVDSAYAGNPARFINHAPAMRANVEISSNATSSSHFALMTHSIPLAVLEVNGERRIGIIASAQILLHSMPFRL